MKRLHVKVTEQDIENGERWSPSFCPVALAVCRAIGVDPEDDEVSVGVIGSAIEFYDDSGFSDASCHAPDSVQTFVDLFDLSCDVEPFSFELDVPGRFITKAHP